MHGFTGFDNDSAYHKSKYILPIYLVNGASNECLENLRWFDIKFTLVSLSINKMGTSKYQTPLSKSCFDWFSEPSHSHLQPQSHTHTHPHTPTTTATKTFTTIHLSTTKITTSKHNTTNHHYQQQPPPSPPTTFTKDTDHFEELLVCGLILFSFYLFRPLLLILLFLFFGCCWKE